MAATAHALLLLSELIKDDLPTFGYPTTPTVRDEWGVDRAYCLSKWSSAGAPSDDEVVGSAGAEGAAWPTGSVDCGVAIGTAFCDRLWRCD